MKVILLFGTPAVGKLTTALAISSKTGYKVLHNHLIIDLVGSVFDWQHNTYWKLSQDFWESMIEQAAIENINIILTCCYIDERDSRYIQSLIQLVKKQNGVFNYNVP